jgi:peptidyl-prolyl cis-trans isomerase D
VNDEYKKSFEKIKLEYVGFNPDTLKADLKPTPDELKAYFESHKGYFNIPETRNFELFVADPVKMAQTIQISDSQVQNYYDTHKNDFRTPERVHARHILFMTQGKPKDQIDKIKAKAEDVLKQVKAGGDFAKLAIANSEDPGSASKGGDLGWVVRGQMVPNFEQACFTLKPGQTSDLVTTEYGFHIVQVLEKQDAHLQPLSEVKDQIAMELKKNQVNDVVQNSADQARADLAKNPQNGAQIAAKYNLQLINVENHKNGDAIAEIGADPTADSTVTSLKKGEISPVFQTKEKLAFLELTAINPTHPAQYAEVETQVRDQYLRDKANQIVQEKAKKVRDLVNSNGGDLNAAAKAVGAEVKTTDEFSRGGAAEGLGSAAQLSEAFDKPTGGIIGPTPVGNQTIVAKVVDKVEPDPSKMGEQRSVIVNQIKSRKSAERAALFRDGIVRQLEKDGKIKIHKDALDRLIARYRS